MVSNIPLLILAKCWINTGEIGAPLRRSCIPLNALLRSFGFTLIQELQLLYSQIILRCSIWIICLAIMQNYCGWKLQLQEYNLNIRHRRGVDNLPADVLSRPSSAATPSTNGGGTTSAKASVDRNPNIARRVRWRSRVVLPCRAVGHYEARWRRLTRWWLLSENWLEIFYMLLC